MAKITACATSESIPSQTAVVDAFMKALKHPMKEVAQLVRETILAADKSVGEEIAWNAPSFYYTGKMQPFNPKEYKRCIVNMNFFKNDCLRPVFLFGTAANDKSGLLKGDYKDGRRLALFHNLEEVKAGSKDLQKAVKEIIKLMK